MKKQNFFKLLSLFLVTSAAFAQVQKAQTLQVGNTSTNAQSASAALQIDSTTKGLLTPRMTQTQRNAIATPATGLMVWCTNCGTAGELQIYNGTTWTNFIGGTASAPATVPGAPTSPVATAGNTQASVAFTAPASDGGSVITGYTVTSSPGNLTSTGASSPRVVTGLSNGTSYTFTVVATNAVGNSSPSVASAAVTPVAPFICGTSTVTFTYNGASVTYGTVTGANSKCWLDRNLGATQVATGSTDHLAYGDLFQWGRGADGHQRITWTNATTGTVVNGTTATLSTTDTPGDALFITNGTSPFDWRSGQNVNLWQGVSGTNNPCPSGYRLPTETEIEAERNNGGTGFWGTGSAQNNAAGAFASPLKLPMSGRRNHSNGTIYNVGTGGYYWGSTVSGTNSRGLHFNSSNAFMNTDLRASGFAVRCLKD